ncbi:hypothetical protein HY495_02135 [Candidatus Woesearchaeota archaeon]|nr:hypothetical protein [Candidatus Woesearchaeota archaeon]
MNRHLLVVSSVLALLFVVLFVLSCAPQVPQTEEGVVSSPEETEIAAAVDDLDELETLDEELTQDVSFDEVDQLLE